MKSYVSHWLKSFPLYEIVVLFTPQAERELTSPQAPGHTCTHMYHPGSWGDRGLKGFYMKYSKAIETHRSRKSCLRGNGALVLSTGPGTLLSHVPKRDTPGQHACIRAPQTRGIMGEHRGEQHSFLEQRVHYTLESADS